MKLDPLLLKDQENFTFSEVYNGCVGARGLYSPMQFVLRLSPNVHAKLNEISEEIVIANSTNFDFETIQAYSTYIHETIHWWQHAGSILGFMLSFSYPSQAHVNHGYLKDYLKNTGAIKSITKYNEQNGKDFTPKDIEFITINNILNNFFDIEFFKYQTIVPKEARQFATNKYFESIGHSYYITYHSFINLLSGSIDKNLTFLPRIDKWSNGFADLREKKVPGYYYGSPITIPPIGLKEIFEGQANFTQIQYLHFGSGGKLDWEEFGAIGMLSGVYYEAFKVFLEITESERPSSVDSPMVALFMIVLDMSINPTDGFPFDITHFESFIPSIDPGIRFYLLCRSILNNEDLKSTIKEYSSSEYYHVSQLLSKSINCPSPIYGSAQICNWLESNRSLQDIMLEESTFRFSDENMPIRLMISKFIEFQQNKIREPAFFCWPGVYCSGEKLTSQTLSLFLSHQSLFMDKSDGNIYPRIIPGKEKEDIQNTFDTFYSWVTTYDLCRQWVATPGEFKFDYTWLSNKYTPAEMKKWANNYFKLSFGVDTDSFRIL